MGTTLEMCETKSNLPGLELREKNLFKTELKIVDKFSMIFSELCDKSYQSKKTQEKLSKNELLRTFLDSIWTNPEKFSLDRDPEKLKAPGPEPLKKKLPRSELKTLVPRIFRSHPPENRFRLSGRKNLNIWIWCFIHSSKHVNEKIN